MFRSLRLGGLPGVAKVEVVSGETIRRAGTDNFIQLGYHDLGVPGTVAVHTQILSGPDLVHVARDVEYPDGSTLSVQLVQAAAEGPESVNLYIQHVSDEPKTSDINLHLTAGSFPELCRLHPKETDAYLRPIFRTLRQEHAAFRVDEKSAWEVLADGWTPPADVAAAVEKALPRLASDAYQDREAAVEDLQKLGEPAAVYLMHADRKRLTLEQAMRVDLFLAPYRPLARDQAAKLRDDPDFLVDCLYVDNPRSTHWR